MGATAELVGTTGQQRRCQRCWKLNHAAPLGDPFCLGETLVRFELG